MIDIPFLPRSADQIALALTVATSFVVGGQQVELFNDFSEEFLAEVRDLRSEGVTRLYLAPDQQAKGFSAHLFLESGTTFTDELINFSFEPSFVVEVTEKEVEFFWILHEQERNAPEFLEHLHRLSAFIAQHKAGKKVETGLAGSIPFPGADGEYPKLHYIRGAATFAQYAGEAGLFEEFFGVHQPRTSKTGNRIEDAILTVVGEGSPDDFTAVGFGKRLGMVFAEQCTEDVTLVVPVWRVMATLRRLYPNAQQSRASRDEVRSGLFQGYALGGVSVIDQRPPHPAPAPEAHDNFGS